MVGLLCTGPVRLQCSKCVVCFGHTDRPSCAKIQAVYRLPRTDRVQSVEAIQEMNQGLRTLSVNSHASGFQDNAMELVIEKDLQFHSCGRQSMDKVRQRSEIGDKLVNCHTNLNHKPMKTTVRFATMLLASIIMTMPAMAQHAQNRFQDSKQRVCHTMGNLSACCAKIPKWRRAWG